MVVNVWFCYCFFLERPWLVDADSQWIERLKVRTLYDGLCDTAMLHMIEVQVQQLQYRKETYTGVCELSLWMKTEIYLSIFQLTLLS